VRFNRGGDYGEGMKLGSTPKKFTSDGHRSVEPAETLARIEPLMGVAGVTRVADITDLDRVGIPVFSAIRPTAKSGAISVYNGKGLTKEEAKVSAIMEALERYSAEVRGDFIIRQGVEEFMASHVAVHPMDLILSQHAAFYVMRQSVAWVKGWELNGNEETWVPASAVFHPYVSKMDFPLFRTSTNGLASGNNVEEAVLHGLYEVVERNDWSFAEGRRRITGDIEVPSSGPVKELVERFTSNGIDVHLKDLTTEIGIPTIAAAVDDTVMQDPALLNLGIGTHLDPEVAATKALLEVAQSRLTQIHGAREDAVYAIGNRKLGYERMKRINKMWLTPSGNKRSLDDLPRMGTDDIFDDLQIVRAKINAQGMNRTVVVDLTRKELGIPVVRVIVPGMEVFAIDEDRVGARLMGGFR
ncbi:MAG TPA: YcaO-related McrA-glycine thioamidation protein, partial [Methanomassiliicoccaceae archaeon]|nr:YcaO-related McrA-glycine thioamidation protein [Methanomassiliicoccaceae archaeon]